MQAVQTKYNKPWIMQRADPYVYKHVDGTYYFTASVPEYDHIMLRKADDADGLQNAEEKIIWRKHEKGEMIVMFGHQNYISFLANGSICILQQVILMMSWKIRPYVLECKGEDPVRDEWIELGMMQCANEDEFSFRAFS